jgi:hypothetical protein
MDKDPNEAYLPQFYDMLVETCSRRKVNDCMFFMTRKDFPHLRKDWKESFDSIYGDVELSAKYKGKAFIPVVAQSTTVNHADLPFPTGDDWEDICKEKFFASYQRELKCKNDSTKITPLPWEKRKVEFIWRGQGTGCGNTPDTNPRMKLDLLTREGTIPGLNARITRYTDRIKAVRREDGLHVEYKGSTDEEHRVSMEEQALCKFILNVEGNSAAYRFGPLLGLGFCILNVDSIYTLWFESMIQKSLITDKDIASAHCIRVKHDLSDLGEVIQWCKDHDDICQRIAQNAMQFYKAHFTKDFIYDYVADLCNSAGSLLTPQKNIYDENVKALRPSKLSLNVLSCKPEKGHSNKTILLVPYRDDGNQNRAEQLDAFLKHYKNLPILVIEQSNDGKKFNRGALLNIGYDFCVEHLPSITTFVLHDVDVLMSQDVIRNYYTDDGKGLMHLGNLVKSSKYDSKYFLGRVLRVSKQVFKDMNGFPNTFYGWGGEDDALAHRIRAPVYRPAEPKEGVELETTNDIFENRDPAFVEGFKNERLIADQLQWKIDGVNSLQYTIVENKTMNEWCHKLTVELAPTAEYKKKEEKLEPIVEKEETEEVEVIGSTDSLTVNKEKVILL